MTHCQPPAVPLSVLQNIRRMSAGWCAVQWINLWRQIARSGTRFADNATSVTALRLFAALMIATLMLFLFNSYLVYWRGWPEFFQIFAGLGFTTASSAPLRQIPPLNWIQLLTYGAIWSTAIGFVLATPRRTLLADSSLYADLAAYVIRAAYWAVLLIGLCDMLISFLRVEGFLVTLSGKYLATQLGRPEFRGLYVHYPLLVAALVIACFARTLGFIWLAMFVVLAEFQVVVSRFVFSYEQAFMGDLVRFWYAALFLFASAYTLAHEGHVRVDVLYANFSQRGKAFANIVGVLLFGLPLCWTIILQGMSSRGSSLSSPLLGFEISQSGYGMYVKYLMAGFLLIFAISMALQFVSTFLKNAAQLRDEAYRPVSTQSLDKSI